MCQHPRRARAAFHASCWAYATSRGGNRLGLPTQTEKLGRIVRHSLIPEEGDSLASRAFLEVSAARCIYERWSLPTELCRRIALHLVRPYSIAATLSTTGKPRQITVSLITNIWA